MAYRRFLNDNDYLSTMTEVGMEQLIRGRHERVVQAEQSAELSVVEYLKQHYLVEEELMVGKKIGEYHNQITYPPDVYVLVDSTVYRTLTAINGVKRPSQKTYWKEVLEFEDYAKINEIPVYSQMLTYRVGARVRMLDTVWECTENNGYDFHDIRMPGITPWRRIETYEWVANLSYSVYDVVRYEGEFFMLLDTADPETMDKSVNPLESDEWGQVGDYDEDYAYEVSDHEYVVFQDEVYYPQMPVNADVPTEGVNIVRDDPRNLNLVKHMTRLAVYELHKLISPTNISNVRINDYNDSIQWLRDAQKFRLDPQLPRRVDEHENYPNTGWAIEDFTRPLDPFKMTWYV